MLGFIKREPNEDLVIVRNLLYEGFLKQALAEPIKTRLEERLLSIRARSPAKLLRGGIILSSLLLGAVGGAGILRLSAVQPWLSAALAACASKAPFCTACLLTIGLAGITSTLAYLATYLSVWHVCVNSKRDWTDEKIDETTLGGPRLTLRFGQTVIPGEAWTVKAELDSEQSDPVSIEADGDQIEPKQRTCKLTTASPQNEIRLICRRGSRVRDLLLPWPSRWDVVLHIKWTAYMTDGRMIYTRPIRVPVIVDSQIAMPRLMPTALKSIINLGGESLKSMIGSKKTP